VTASSAEPDLVGKRLPEVPRNTLTAGLEWLAPLQIHSIARLRWVSLQFDDNANTLRLPPATVADFELSRKLGRHLEVFLTVENALNAQVAASLSTAGLYTYDAPRLIRGGLRADW
jgi:outer membrane receptor protein involved in Fe transport